MVQVGHVADKATDVYSFGVVLWEIVSRQRPFGHLNPDLAIVHLSEIHSKGESLDMERLPDDLPQLKPIVRNCLSRVREGRPTFARLVQQLVALQMSFRTSKKQVKPK